MRDFICRISAILCLAVFGLCLPVQAQQAQQAQPVEQRAQPSYAVISLIGNTLYQVYYVGTTGTHLGDGTRQISNAIDPVLFDSEALTEAGKLLQRYQPDVKFNLLSTSDAELYKLQDKLFDDTDASRSGREYLKSILNRWKATHLIVITKHRAPADVRLANSHDGAGWMEGVGFYIDKGIELEDTDTGHAGVGMLVPFVSVKVSLVDAQTLHVLREVSVLKSKATGNIGAADGHETWNLVTPQGRIDALKRLIRISMQQGVPEVLNTAAKVEAKSQAQ